LRDVALGIHQDPAGNPDNLLIRPAACIRRQVTHRLGRHVNADNRKVAILQLENVGTITKRGRLCAAFMRIWAKSSSNHTHIATLVASEVNNFLRYGLVVASNHLRENINSIVARLLREERKRRGFSLNALAQKAGLNRQTISFIEAEDRKPTLDTLLRITEVLGIDVEVLIKRARKLAGRSETK
jgi:DNA-binding XRE family transcriptional regulator